MVLNPRRLQGNFTSATFQHLWLGAAGTPEATLRTLVGRPKVIQDKQNGLESNNVALAEENANLKISGENVDNRIRDAVYLVTQLAARLGKKTD